MAARLYTFPVAGCTVTYSKYHHDYLALDIFPTKGYAIVSPVEGVGDKVKDVYVRRGKKN